MEFDIPLSQLFFYSGLFVCAIGLNNLAKLLSRTNWPKTEGNILTATIKVERVTSSAEIAARDGVPDGSVEIRHNVFLPKFEYVYVVGDNKYQSKNMYSAPLYFLSNNDLDGFYKDSACWVFYNPGKPRVSFVKHSSIWPSIAVFLCGGVMTGYGLYYL